MKEFAQWGNMIKSNDILTIGLPSTRWNSFVTLMLHFRSLSSKFTCRKLRVVATKPNYFLCQRTLNWCIHLHAGVPHQQNIGYHPPTCCANHSCSNLANSIKQVIGFLLPCVLTYFSVFSDTALLACLLLVSSFFSFRWLYNTHFAIFSKVLFPMYCFIHCSVFTFRYSNWPCVYVHGQSIYLPSFLLEGCLLIHYML